jgi:hypothetical protein
MRRVDRTLKARAIDRINFNEEWRGGAAPKCEVGPFAGGLNFSRILMLVWPGAGD